MEATALDQSIFFNYPVELAKKLNSRVTGNTVNLPATLGTGYIKNIVLEEHFCVRYFNLLVKADMDFDFFTQPQEDAATYKLVFSLDATEHDALNDTSTNNVLLYTNGFSRCGGLKRNIRFRKMIILFNEQWLSSNYEEAGARMESLIHGLVTKHRSTIISESLNSKSNFMMMQLAAEMDKPLFPMIHVKTCGFMLVNEFLNGIVYRDKSICSDQTLHYHTILKVEQRIVQSVNKRLPCLEQLALEFNLSLSTLQRHFRIVYGKNIYQYYQEKRLEWGKSQLEHGHVNINEIATQLGFYKINNFSKAFKKHFGVLPRELKPKSFVHAASQYKITATGQNFHA